MTTKPTHDDISMVSVFDYVDIMYNAHELYLDFYVHVVIIIN